MEGWISLHRKFLQWEWYDDNNMVKLFIHLLLSANHSKQSWRGIDIGRGQLLTGLESLNHQTKISVQTLRTCLKRLENTGEINMQVTNKYRIVTICNYDSYQSDQQATNKQSNKQLTSKQQTTNKQLTANNNVNKENKENNVNKDSAPPFEEFKNYALEKEPNINIKDLELKYEAWKVNGWKTGKGVPIKNWRSTLLNTIPHIGKNNSYKHASFLDDKPRNYEQF